MTCARGCCESAAEHYRSIRLAPSIRSTPGGAHAAWGNRAQKQLDKDRAAYKRLREDGLQPPHIDGCAKLETQARSKTEVEMGEVMAGEGKRFAEVTEAIQTGDPVDVKSVL